MATATVNKHQARTQVTREELLLAAEEIFVRDGFEGAQVEEIAVLAGRTKGAVYAHFENKEDLFLAVCGERTKAHIQRFVDMLRNCKTADDKLNRFREFYLDLPRYRAWALLSLEFKLYHIRHPEALERLRHRVSDKREEREIYQHIFGAGSKKHRSKFELAAAALWSVLEGLVVESCFEPELLSEQTLRKLLGTIFDSLLMPSRSE